jgi:hypothetical protein
VENQIAVGETGKSLLCSSTVVRMGFLRQARAGLVTSGCILELVFVLLAAQ